MKLKKTMMLFSALSFFFPLGLWADIPELKEEVIYSIHPFDGKNYLATTFIRETDDTVYLLADADNFLTVKKSLVYYWPESGEWHTDSSTLNHIFEGTMDITDRTGETKIVEPVEYTYFNLKTDYSYRMNWQIATGEEAYEALRELEQMAGTYKRKADERAAAHNRIVFRIEQAMTELVEKKRRGEDTSELERTIETLKETEEKLKIPPPRPWEDTYRVPPVPLEWGFVINLPEGEYEGTFHNPEGKRLQQTTKRLVVFKAGRKDYIGYDIRPGDSYMQPLRLTDPHGVVYVKPGTELYLEPFYQHEYRELYYNRMSGRSETGNPNIKNWVKIESVEKAAGLNAEISSDRKKLLAEDLLHEKPYSVEQLEGGSLGFRIVPYQPNGNHKGKDPHFSGYHLSIPSRAMLDSKASASDGGRNGGEITISLINKEGKTIAHSTRTIKIVKTERSGLPFLTFIAAPLVMMLIILTRRRKKT